MDPLVLVFCHSDITPEKTILEEEKLVLAHGVNAFSPWPLGHVSVGLGQQSTSWRGCRKEVRGGRVGPNISYKHTRL